MLSNFCYAGDERPNAERSAVVLNFMSVKCEPCKQELPQFLTVMRSSIGSASKSGGALRFFIVSVDPLSEKESLRKYIEERHVNLESELLLDPYHKAADKFGVTSIPRTIVISSQGVVVSDIAGIVDNYAEHLRIGVEAALKTKGNRE